MTDIVIVDEITTEDAARRVNAYLQAEQGLSTRANFFANQAPDAPLVGAEAALEYVRRWHDGAHPLPWPVCDLEPCYGLRHLL